MDWGETMYALTTSDNPYHPIQQFNEWYAFDTRAGHHSLALLARIAKTSDALSPSDEERIIDDAIEEIVRENVSGVHMRVRI
jgi:hypothetical protein